MPTDKDKLVYSPSWRVMVKPPARVTGYLSELLPFAFNMEVDPILVNVDSNAYFDEDKAKELGLIP